LVPVLAVAALAVALSVALALRSAGDVIDRIEREHAIELPDSVDAAGAFGDASNSFVSLVGLDRGASSVFTIDRSDLDQLLAEFDVDGPGSSVDPAFGPTQVAPANTQYQPTSVPWSADQPDKILGIGGESSNGDFTNIGIFPVDDTTIGIWLYTDWN
jgi:hypothetical protein